jgi:hypothetical protein
MCWNAVMRLLLPVMAATILLVILLEAVMGGLDGVAMLLGGGLLVSLTGIMGMVLTVMLLVFILQGDDLLDCVVDARGIHVQKYLPEPTALKLVLRGKSPRMLDAMGDENLLLVSSTEIAWKDITRVQLWPEKNMILFYAPKWWMRLALPCTPFTWEDALDCIREKIGKKKAVTLPEICRQAAPAKAKAAPKKAHQLTFDEVAAEFGGQSSEPALPENVTGELESDFTSLEDVLQEIKENA